MKYLIDTDVLIDNLRRKTRIDEEIVESGAGISIINLGELIYGAFKSSNPAQALQLVEDLLVDFRLEIIDLEKEMIYIFGKLKADLETKGDRLEDFDLLIAATAKANGLTLVTRNVDHFKRIKGLKLR